VFDLNREDIDVGVEINDEPHPDRTTAAVRYFVENKDGERVYISREDALAINQIDHTCWLKAIERTLSYMRDDADRRHDT